MTILLEILLMVAKFLAEVLVKIVVERFVAVVYEKLSLAKRNRKSDSKFAATSRRKLR